MIRSMTGFGRGEYNDGKRNILVEIKSVNHRYSEIQVRMPRRYSFAEDAVRSEVKRYTGRGKIDVQYFLQVLRDERKKVSTIRSYLKVLHHYFF